MKTMLFNPYNGLPRHPSDIQSDPQGLMMVDPDEPLRSAPKREPLTNDGIIEIAKNPMTTPCSPWWLKDEVILGDVRQAALMFARAIEAAHGIKDQS